MHNSEVVVERFWPHKRNPAVPFFIFEIDLNKFVVAGTFPDGTPCMLAVPKNVKDKSWFSWLSAREAEAAARHLNALHEKRLIDWSGKVPKIVRDAEKTPDATVPAVIAAH